MCFSQGEGIIMTLSNPGKSNTGIWGHDYNLKEPKSNTWQSPLGTGILKHKNMVHSLDKSSTNEINER